MAIAVKKNCRVLTGDKEYFPGEVIFGLDPKEEKKLVNEGYCIFEETAVDPALYGPIKSDLTSLERFVELKAGDQKELLQTCGIEPGSNEKERIDQYTEWLKAQETGGESGSNTGTDEVQDPDHNGPNTGLPAQ